MQPSTINIDDVFQIDPILRASEGGKTIVDLNERLRNLRFYWR